MPQKEKIKIIKKKVKMNKGKVLGAIFCILMGVLIFGIGFVDKESNKDTVTLFQVYLFRLMTV